MPDDEHPGRGRRERGQFLSSAQGRYLGQYPRKAGSDQAWPSSVDMSPHPYWFQSSWWQEAAEAFYRIADAVYERRSVAVTSISTPPKPHVRGNMCKAAPEIPRVPWRADDLAGGGECLVGEDGRDGARIDLGGDGDIVGKAPFGQFPARGGVRHCP